MSERHLGSFCLVALFLLAGCAFDGAGPQTLGGQKDSGPLVFNDGLDLHLEGPASDGIPDASDGMQPSPDTTGDQLPPDMLSPDTTMDTIPSECLACGLLGCNVTLGRCNRLAPSNIPAPLVAELHDDGLLGDCLLSHSIEPPANGEKGSFGGCRPQGSEGMTRGGVYWDTITLPGGQLATLFAMNSLVIQGNVTLRGEGPHPIIVYAREGITLRGLIDVAARAEGPGPGGKAGGAADGDDGAACLGGEGKGGDLFDVWDDKSGGGGGAWGQRGADGGTANAILGGVGGQLPASSPSVALVPLRGGCGGGAGGGSSSEGGSGGGGGGAIQFSAGTVLIVDGKGINAAGGGGGGGTNTDGGGGGGSGGSILLEAPSVRVTSSTPLSANGGGGGAGGPTGVLGKYGDDGQHSILPAAGGMEDLPAGDGGQGGARGLFPSEGESSTSAGGGGGGTGRIHVRATEGVLQSQQLSPPVISDSLLSLW